MTRVITFVMALLGLAACSDQTVSANLVASDFREVHDAPPAGADPAACWSKATAPAQIATVTHKVLLQPAEIGPNGKVISPPVYRTEAQPKVIAPRQQTWFETPCPPAYTPEFIASIQRALQARGHYRGPITSAMDKRTKAAIRRFQREQALNSAVLSTASARMLGLVAVVTEPVL